MRDEALMTINTSLFPGAVRMQKNIARLIIKKTTTTTIMIPSGSFSKMPTTGHGCLPKFLNGMTQNIWTVTLVSVHLKKTTTTEISPRTLLTGSKELRVAER